MHRLRRPVKTSFFLALHWANLSTTSSKFSCLAGTRDALHSGPPWLCLPCLPHCYGTGQIHVSHRSRYACGDNESYLKTFYQFVLHCNLKLAGKLTLTRRNAAQQGCRGYGDSHGDSNEDSCGYGMGMGIEMPSPRQPCRPVTNDFGLCFLRYPLLLFCLVSWLLKKHADVFASYPMAYSVQSINSNEI